MVKRLSAVSLIATMLACSPASAGSGYDACRGEEVRLRGLESDRCTGWGYVLNPSACFNTRKALTPYNNGKCRAIAVSEGVVEKKGDSGPVPVGNAAPQPVRGNASGEGAVGQPPPAAPVAYGDREHPSELDQLRREVAALRSEVERLREELSRLREGR